MIKAIKGKIGCAVLCTALLSGMLQPAAEASAKKGVKLSASSLSLTVGKTKTVKLTGAGKATWSVSGKAVKVTKKGKKSIQLKGLRKGKATVTAKIKTKKVSCRVTVSAEKSKTKPSSLPAVEEASVPAADNSPVPAGASLDQLSMTAQGYDPKTNTVTIDISNNTSGVLTYGRMFRLERYEDEKWVTVPFVGGVEFTCDAIMLVSGGKASETFALRECFGMLSDGKYRIAKTVFCDALTKDSIVLYAEFNITGNGTVIPSPSAEPEKTETPFPSTGPGITVSTQPAVTASPSQPVTPSPVTAAPPQENVTPAPQIPIRRDAEDGEMVGYANCKVYAMACSMPDFPDPWIISDTEDLEELEGALEKWATNHVNDPVNILLNQLAGYDEEYFEENSLALGNYEKTYGYAVLPQQVIAEGERITCQVQTVWNVLQDESVPDVMVDHRILLELPKSEVGDGTEFALETCDKPVLAPTDNLS